MAYGYRKRVTYKRRATPRFTRRRKMPVRRKSFTRKYTGAVKRAARGAAAAKFIITAMR